VAKVYFDYFPVLNLSTLRSYSMRWLAQLITRRRRYDELSETIREHLDEKIADLMDRGMTREEAEQTAHREFGNVTRIEERSREVWRWAELENLWADVKFAFRQSGRNPGFAATVILTVALGIGLNTAMFSVINAVLLKPLGYHDPDRLVLPSSSVTPIHFDDLISSARSYEGLGAYSGREDLALSGDGQPEMLKGARVSGNFLDILGVKPLLGRSFLPSEDKPGAPAVAMISEELWKGRFGGAPSVIGHSVTLAGTAYTVIGVLPQNFHFPSAGNDVWLTRPSEWSVLKPESRRISPILQVFGRLKPGVSISQAGAELLLIDQQYETAHPGMLDSDKTIARLWNRPPIHLVFLKNQLVSNIRSELWMLFGAVGLVLLIVCANIASLLLARATTRSREFAVRAAIGAGRERIIEQLLTESLLLSFMGGTIGIALAWIGVRMVRSMTALGLPRSGEIRIDGMVLLFAVALSLFTGILFGLAPSLSASRPNLVGVLQGSGEGANIAGRKPGFLRLNSRSLLVAGQVALSTVLLIGAALLIESLARVYRVDPGFQASNVLTMSIALSPTRYNTDQKEAAFYDSLLERIRALPGVKSAATTTALPMTPYPMAQVQVVGREAEKHPLAMILSVSPQYFQVMNIPLRRGREFSAHDDFQALPAAIISESMAHRFWPQYPGGPDPIGQHILIGSHSKPTEIVGIAADTREYKLTMEPGLGVYLSSSQQPAQSVSLAIRTENDPLLFVNAVRNQILELDRDQPVSAVASMSQVVDASEGQLSVMMILLGIFAAAAMIIAVVGLYGVIAYSVTQRTKEIGIRKALGARHGNILVLVVTHGLRIALFGLMLGICGALALTQVLRGLLFEVSPTDPVTFIGIVFLFVSVSLMASYFPAQRAASVDPMRALRSE
jgi:putative ABC transport system permease protein